MPLFRCTKCGCVENSAYGYFWMAKLEQKPPLCSECDPEIGEWHGKFEKRSAVGQVVTSDGQLFHPNSVEELPQSIKERIIGIYAADGTILPYKPGGEPHA